VAAPSGSGGNTPRTVTDGDGGTDIRRASITAVMVGNLVAEAAVRCRAEPDNLSPRESALSGGDRVRRHDVT
jgi:hypothetical protein